MRIQLSDHFTLGRLLRFTLPSIAMMLSTSIFGVVDGFFVSNFAGKIPFAAVNLIMPFLMMVGAVGSMFGAGGSALVAKTLGEGEAKKANRIFSLLVYTAFACGVIFAVAGILFLRPISLLLGATPEMLDDCVVYGRIILCALPTFILQYAFQSFFPLAEKPKLGLAVTISAGVVNLILDALLVGVFRLGIAGAAVATAVSQAVGGLVPILYFARPNGSLLRLGRTRYDGTALWRSASNGLSELLSNITFSLVSMLYNAQLMRYAAENGVAAYGVLMYVSMIFCAVFFGFSIGCSPVISYHYGAKNRKEVRNLLKICLIFLIGTSLAMAGLSELSAGPLTRLYVGYDAELSALTLRGFSIFSFAFLFTGVAMFGSSFFTALNNGPVSALLSFARTVVFGVGSVLLLPIWLGVDGIWTSLVTSELMGALLSAVLLFALRDRYQYGRSGGLFEKKPPSPPKNLS